jgi:hypothetical protein
MADIIQLWEANHTAYVWLSNGSGFSNYSVWGTGVSSNDRIGDFDGDGKADIVQLWEANHTAYVWLSTGNAFSNYAVWGTGVSSADKFGDLNADGKDDLIHLSDDGVVSVRLSNGSSFGAPQTWGNGLKSIDRIADFNGDHRQDVIQLSADGNGYVWFSTGNAFDPYKVWATGIGLGDDTGNDLFAFNSNFGKDIITDFQAGVGAGDVIQFDHTLFANFNAVLSKTTDDGHGNTVITYDANNTLTIQHILKANLAADDFLFV